MKLLTAQIDEGYGDSLTALFISTKSEGVIKLEAIVIKKDQRKQGIGSQIMMLITEYADKHNLVVCLSPALKDDNHGTTSRNRLVRFYKRFGFVENKGRNKDFTFTETMIRQPAN